MQQICKDIIINTKVLLKDPPYGGNLIKPPWFEGGKKQPLNLEPFQTPILFSFYTVLI